VSKEVLQEMMTSVTAAAACVHHWL